MEIKNETILKDHSRLKQEKMRENPKSVNVTTDFNYTVFLLLESLKLGRLQVPKQEMLRKFLEVREDKKSTLVQNRSLKVYICKIEMDKRKLMYSSW